MNEGRGDLPCVRQHEDAMTADELERRYAARGGCTVEDLRACERRVAECYCGEEGCTGYQVLSFERVETEEQDRCWRRRWEAEVSDEKDEGR